MQVTGRASRPGSQGKRGYLCRPWVVDGRCGLKVMSPPIAICETRWNDCTNCMSSYEVAKPFPQYDNDK